MPYFEVQARGRKRDIKRQEILKKNQKRNKCIKSNIKVGTTQKQLWTNEVRKASHN